MALWSWVSDGRSPEVRGAEDGDWAKLAVWLGNPPQLLSALVSTNGTTLQVPVDPSCSGSGSFNDTIQLPDHGPTARREWQRPRYRFGDIGENGEHAGRQYLPQASETWESSSGCFQGSDLLRGVLWQRYVRQADTWFSMGLVRVPVQQTFGIANIGLRAIATSWQGKQDYWWPLMVLRVPSLLQSLPLLSYWVPGFRGSGFMYTYRAGASYRGTYAYLWIGQLKYSTADPHVNMLRRPLAQNGALMLDSMTLELNLKNSSGQGNTSISLIPNPTKAVLDSTLPFLELPRDVCFTIAKELDLQYDESTGLFGMDKLIVSRLETVRPSLQFNLGSHVHPPRSPGEPWVWEPPFTGGPVEVELPFEALKHMHTPLVSEHTNRGKPYFPIRIAEEERGIVLGRTIFQELWLSVDYDTKEFMVGPDDDAILINRPHYRIGFSSGAPKEWPLWLTPLLSQTILAFIVLSALMFLPSLKIAYNMQERHHRRRKLERSWVQSHTVSITTEELSRYANAVAKRAGRNTTPSRGHVFGASVVWRLMKSASQCGHVVLLWLVHRHRSGEGAIRAPEFDEEQEENARPRQGAHAIRRRAIVEQQKQLRNAWRRGKRMGYWFYQHLLAPTLKYTVVKPFEWTIRIADFSGKASRRLALARRRQGEICLE